MWATACPATQIGPYRINEMIGEGGIGNVYRAIDERDQSPCAVKIVQGRSWNGTLGPWRMACRDEALVLSLARHPCIVRLRDFIEERQFTCLALERLDGVSLDRVLGHSLGIAVHPFIVVEIGLQMTRALHHLHGLRLHGRPLGVVHNDMKPGNIIVLSSGRFVLIDPGLATFMGTFRTVAQGETVGSPLYMSPELAQGKPWTQGTDGRSDLFSLGGVLVELATGVHPFIGPPTRAGVVMEIAMGSDEARERSVIALRDTLPELIPIIIKLIQSDPDARFSSARELDRALMEVRGKLVGTSSAQIRAHRAFVRSWATATISQFPS